MENKYYTPTLRELLIAIIDGDEIYSRNKDSELIAFKSKSPLSSLYEFIMINNKQSNIDGSIDFSINLNNYLLKIKDGKRI
jgi:hypothetical protein